MPKKPVSILKREAIASKERCAQFNTRKKRRISQNSTPAGAKESLSLAKDSAVFKTANDGALKARWFCASTIARDASRILGRILGARRSGGKVGSLKSLTLAPDVKEKKATHAVVCKALEHLSIIDKLIQSVGLLDANPSLPHEVRDRVLLALQDVTAPLRSLSRKF
jgi:hypothetical protein